MTSTNIYCTYVTFYSGNKLPPFYIGSTSVDKINKGYHGSVSSRKFKTIYKQELNNNPHLFKTKIISLHENRRAAYIKEQYIHEQFNVVKSPMYFNLGTAIPNFDGTSNKGIKRTQKFKDNLSVISSNKRHSEETKQKMKRPKSDSHREKIATNNRFRGKLLKGTHLTETTKKLISERLSGIPKPYNEKMVVVFDLVDNTYCKVSSEVYLINKNIRYLTTSAYKKYHEQQVQF